MKKLFYGICLMIVGIATANAQSEETIVGKANNDIPYQKAENYFVKNNYPDREMHVLTIKSQQDFDAIFGAAPLMGEKGRPTEIDFKKSYVIALINNSSDHISGLDIKSLTKETNGIRLIYSLAESEKSSHTSRYFTLLIVNKKYKGKVTAHTSQDTNNAQ